MSDNGVSVVKDGGPALMTWSGVGMTVTPIFIIQVIGCVVGITGVILGYRRNKIADKQAQETKRANDLKQEQWEHQLSAYSTSKKTEAKAETEEICDSKKEKAC